jgi:hypothetical protein
MQMPCTPHMLISHLMTYTCIWHNKGAAIVNLYGPGMAVLHAGVIPACSMIQYVM